MTDKAKKRKNTPVYSGVIDYFPDAIREVARVSYIGNEQHNPGQPLHWAKGKSNDHEDALLRHLMDHKEGIVWDDDTALHLGKVAWRALALLQTHFDEEKFESMDDSADSESSPLDCNCTRWCGDFTTCHPREFKENQKTTIRLNRDASFIVYDHDSDPLDSDGKSWLGGDRMNIIGQNGNDGNHYEFDELLGTRYGEGKL